MKLVYLAGPYRSTSIYGVMQNIREAEDIAVEIWNLGVAVICPHKNSAFLDGAVDEPQDENMMVTGDSIFFKGDLEMVKRCDALVLMPKWYQSQGTRQENTFAVLNGVPVFRWTEDRKDFMDWARHEQTTGVVAGTR
jgi:nucleoside 2-deoxyribosyltransferase